MDDTFTLPSDADGSFALPSDSAPPPATLGQSALDVAKQLPSGAAVGLESIPSLVPSAMGAIGRGVEWGINKLGLQSSEAAEDIRQREALRASIHPWSVASLLPQPQTEAGQYARTIGEFAPAAVAGPGSLARRVMTQDVAPAVASEAAGQATAGTAAEPYARVGAAVLGGFPFGRWRTAQAQAASAAPLVDDLYDAGRSAYDQIRQSGFALKPQPVATLADQIEQELTRKGLTERNVPETYGVVRDLQDLRNAKPVADPVTGKMVQPTVPADSFDSARQELLQASRNATNRREGAAAWTAIGKLDDYLSNVPQGHVASGDAASTAALFDEARGNWAAAKRLEMAGGKVDLGNLNAETAHSGMNIDNAMRQAVKQLIRPNKYGKTLAEQHGFSDDEIGLMNDIAKGTMTRNSLRYVGNLLGGGGGFGQLALTGLGMGAGYETGNPAFLALPALGAAARYGAGRMARADAERLLGAVGRRSPLGRSAGLTPALPSQASSLLGAGAVRAAQPPVGGALPGLPPLQGPSVGRADDHQNIPGPPSQQKRGGAVAQQQRFAHGGKVSRFDPKSIGARKAKDGKHYLPDPRRPGKWLQVIPRA